MSVGGKDSGQKTPKLPSLGRGRDAARAVEVLLLVSFFRPGLLRVLQTGPEKIQLFLSTREREGAAAGIDSEA